MYIEDGDNRMSNFFKSDGAAFSSNKEDWETPQALYDKLNAIYHFTLDAAASSLNAKCDNYFTIKENGLKQTWSGRVFCNPPYNRKLREWVKKAVEEANNCEVIVMLIPARTDTTYFHDYIYKKENIKVDFIRGRLKYEDKGVAKDSSPFPSMIVGIKGEGVGKK